MNPVRIITLSVITFCTAETALSQIIPRRNTTRPCVCRCIPSQPKITYQYRQSASPIMAMSNSAISLDVTRIDAAGGTASLRPLPKLFQWNEDKLEIEHCSISQMALQLFPDGKWVLSLRADQNRKPGDEEAAGFNPKLHIKRNEFVVRMRFYDSLGGSPTTSELTAGKPMLDHQEVAFWVQNGQPRYVRTSGISHVRDEQFARVDRVELEYFFYR